MPHKYKEYLKYQHFFDFLCTTMEPESHPPLTKEMDWQGLFEFVCKQAISGVVFKGVDRLAEQGDRPSFHLLMKWIANSIQIEKKNRILNQKCAQIVAEYRALGFECCVLKGQGNTLLYPYPYTRMSGDIDLLIHNTKRKQLLNYLQKEGKLRSVHFQHVEYEDDGIPVEIHFLPTYANNPLYHQRLLQWLENHSDGIWDNWVELPDGMGKITVPTIGYNLIYQLSHMQGHFFDEGIGLRQMIDYYYLLKSGNNNQVQGSRFKDYGQLTVQGSRFKVQGSTKSLEETLKYLNLYKFAGAVMWVLHEVFGMEEDYYLVPPDEWRGKLLLDEILKGGNFGKYSGLTNHSTGVKYFLKIRRNLRFVRAYPSEALCEPFFRTWHFFWRMMHS